MKFSPLFAAAMLFFTTERFQLDTKYLGEFKVRKSSIGGFEIIS